MGILGSAFLALLLITFPLLIFASRPSKHQQMLERRLGQMGLGDGHEKNAASGELLKPTGDSKYPTLEAILLRLRIYQPLDALIHQANSATNPIKVAGASVAVAVGAFFVALVISQGWVLPPLALLAGGSAPVVSLLIKRSRRLKAFNAALPDAIDLMARALRAGHSVPSAIEVVAEQSAEPVAGEFALVYQQQNFGLPFRDALLNLAERNRSQDLRFVVTAMLVQKETGGNLAEILDRTTHVIRERIRIQGEVRVKSAQGRLSGWILSLLPILMGVLINIVNPGFEKPLLTEHIGRVMICAGAFMLIAGGLVIRNIVKIEV
jgi:tight adherence protein B